MKLFMTLFQTLVRAHDNGDPEDADDQIDSD
jgi:hypothetical protein